MIDAIRRSPRRAAATLGAFTALWLVCGSVDSGDAPSEVPSTAPAQVEPGGPHRVWVPDRIWHHSALFDGDTAQVVGMIDSPYVTVTPKLPMHAHRRGEIYSVDLAYSHGTRGERVDFITIYDDRTFGVTGEIALPTHTGDSNSSIAYAALLDGERFLVSFNQFPLASVSISDVEQRRFVGELSITGCAGVFPTGERSFATLCGDGTALAVDLDADGRGRLAGHTERFFDPVEDPVTMAGVRWGSRWTFVSFEGNAHVVEFATRPPQVAPAWSLFSDAERSEQWRVGGIQHLALHAATGHLYSLVHHGGRGSHKAPGEEIWVYDIAQHQRVGRFTLPNFMAAFASPQFGVTSGGWFHRALQRWIPSDGAHTLVVTQDDAPLLFVRNAEVGVVAVLDANSGEHLRNLEDAGIAGPTLGVD
jgi:methylamine dehydrogenase heavy chain